MRSPAGRDWSNTRPTSTVAFGSRRILTFSPAATELLSASRSTEPTTSGTDDRLRLVQLVLDLRVDVPPRDDRCRHQQHRQEPRPERPPPRLVVFVEPGRPRVRRRRARRRRDDRHPPRDRRRRGRQRRGPGAAQHLRRRLLRLRRDRLAARRAREVGVHLVRALVAVLRVLRERAQDDRVELVRHLGPRLRRRQRRRREVLHRDLERRVPGERNDPSSSRTGRSRPSRCPRPASPARPSPARARGTAPSR